MSEEIEISSDKTQLDISLVHSFISRESYWGKGRSIEEVRTTIDNSMCFGVYKNGGQIGFCRVVTDQVTFAYVMDFFILNEFRHKGIGRRLMEEILAQPSLASVRWLLATKDANDFYNRFGFEPLKDPSRIMERFAVQGS